MTSKEALGLLASRVQVGAYKEEMQKCFDVVNEAINKLEKRDTPMKPLKVNNTKLIYWCSKCDCSSIQRYDKFCHECGQRLDWSNLWKKKLLKRKIYDSRFTIYIIISNSFNNNDCYRFNTLLLFWKGWLDG